MIRADCKAYFFGIHQKWIASTKSTTMYRLFVHRFSYRGGLELKPLISFSSFTRWIMIIIWIHFSPSNRMIIHFNFFRLFKRPELVDLAIVKRSILFQLRLRFMLFRLCGNNWALNVNKLLLHHTRVIVVNKTRQHGEKESLNQTS